LRSCIRGSPRRARKNQKRSHRRHHRRKSFIGNNKRVRYLITCVFLLNPKTLLKFEETKIFRIVVVVVTFQNERRLQNKTEEEEEEEEQQQKRNKC